MTDPDPASGSAGEPATATPSEEFRLAAEALLRQRLNRRTAQLPTRWSAADGSHGALIDLNDLALLANAWLARDPAVAIDLLHTAFAFQQPDGFVPRRFRSDGFVPDRVASWPILAQTVWTSWNRLADPAPLTELWLRVQRYGAWLINEFLSRPQGPPRWRSESEAFVPETWDAGLATVDLTVLLLAEMDALAQFADVTGHPKEAESFRRQREPLAGHLRGTFWDAGHGRYADRYAASGPVARATVSALLPLLWNGLDGDSRTRILRDYRAGRIPAAGERGIPLWERWPEDENDAPAPLAQQYVLWLALRQAGAAAEASFLRDRLLDRLEADWRRALSFTAEPPPVAAAPERDAVPPEKQSLTAAALALCLLDQPGAGRARALESSRPVQWMEMHRRGFQWAALVALLLGFLALVWLGNRSRALSPGMVETTVADAVRDLRSGHPEPAIRRLEAVMARLSAPPPQMHFLLGNARYAAGDFDGAAKAYLEISAEHDLGPRARYNLSLSLYHQGRPRESLEAFSDFIALYGRQFPELERRARRAMILIQLHPCPPAAGERGPRS